MVSWFSQKSQIHRKGKITGKIFNKIIKDYLITLQTVELFPEKVQTLTCKFNRALKRLDKRLKTHDFRASKLTHMRDNQIPIDVI